MKVFILLSTHKVTQIVSFQMGRNGKKEHFKLEPQLADHGVSRV